MDAGMRERLGALVYSCYCDYVPTLIALPMIDIYLLGITDVMPRYTNITE